MPNSPRMRWPYPSQDQDPWFDPFEDFVEALDASAYASREDRNLILAGGGDVGFDATSGVLSWGATLEILSPISGFRMNLAAGSVTLAEGQVVYVNLVRYPTNNVTVTASSGNQIPSNDTALALAIRRGSAVYFRHGLVINDGETLELFAPGGGGGGGPGSSGTIIWGGGRQSHNSTTPLVVAAFAFTPTTYDPGVTSLVFRAIAANGDTGLTNYVQLYNLTDSQLVAQLDFTSTTIAKDEAILVRGTGATEVDDPEHIYEVRILLGAAPGDASDTIELYSAELRVF